VVKIVQNGQKRLNQFDWLNGFKPQDRKLLSNIINLKTIGKLIDDLLLRIEYRSEWNTVDDTRYAWVWFLASKTFEGSSHVTHIHGLGVAL